jgi:hypothetical protein
LFGVSFCELLYLSQLWWKVEWSSCMNPADFALLPKNKCS